MSGHIVLVSNPFRDMELHAALHCADLLRGYGFEVRVAPIFAEKYKPALNAGETLYDLRQAVQDAALLVTFGGDGTLLQAAQFILGSDLPLLGVNLGHKGFLTEFSADEIELLPSALLAGYDLQPRMLLHAELIRQGEVIMSGDALNDITVNGIVNTIRLAAYGDEEPIMEFGGDGIIVATPTGATAYSLSAGGPLMEPDAENIIISSICPHVLGARSFVLAPDKEIEIKTERLHGRGAYLSVDGNTVCDILNGDILKVKRSLRYTVMADLGNRSFFEIAYSKLI